MLIDVHTHLNFPEDPQELHLYNLIVTEMKPEVPDSGYFSAGIHPWFISEDSDSAFENLENIVKLDQCLAIGECGLDSLRGPAPEIQQRIFQHQVQLAESVSKPIIIHAVRSYNSLIRIKKSLKSKVPWVLHGFSGNPQQFNELLRHGFYFSVGPGSLPRLIKHEILAQIPFDKLFLETDESEKSLFSLYQEMAIQMQVEMTQLESLINSNFRNIFLRNSIL